MHSRSATLSPCPLPHLALLIISRCPGRSSRLRSPSPRHAREFGSRGPCRCCPGSRGWGTTCGTAAFRCLLLARRSGSCKALFPGEERSASADRAAVNRARTRACMRACACRGGGQLGPPSTLQNTACYRGNRLPPPRLKFQCSQYSVLTGLMGDEKLMFDLHAISVALAGLLPAAFYGGLHESLDASDRRRGARDSRCRASGPGCVPVPVAYRRSTRAAALASPRRSAGAKPRMRFWLGSPRPLRAGMETWVSARGRLAGGGGTAPWHPAGLPARAPAASRENRHRAACASC